MILNHFLFHALVPAYTDVWYNFSSFRQEVKIYRNGVWKISDALQKCFFSRCAMTYLVSLYIYVYYVLLVRAEVGKENGRMWVWQMFRGRPVYCMDRGLGVGNGHGYISFSRLCLNFDYFPTATGLPISQCFAMSSLSHEHCTSKIQT